VSGNVQPFRYMSVCSGIEAASVAWKPLGWECAGYSEIEPFPRAVLEQRLGAVAVDWDHRHAPGQNFAPLFGDFTRIESHHVGPVDLLVGGTPCQSFSIAGKRLGLDDPRGNLAIEFLALARRLGARWMVWENVPGVLSSWSGSATGAPIDENGRWIGGPGQEWQADLPETGDFHAFLDLFRECGYRGCYRVLDAQYVRVAGHERAVPQRRERVFVVGHLGDDARAVPVLFEPESLRGHPAPRRQAGEGVAPTISARPSGGGGLGTDFDCDGGLIASQYDDGSVAAVTSKWAKGSGGPAGDECQNLVAHTLSAEGFDASEDGTGQAAIAIQERAVSENIDAGPQGKGYQEGVGYTLEARNKVQAVAFAQNTRDEVRLFGGDGSIVGALGADMGMKQQCYVAQSWAVRRLTPLECERLQGFPDGWTNIAWRGKVSAPDGPRYKAIGNSMAVNVMRWLGQRIDMVEKIMAAHPPP